jgi:hypothetical protein
VTPLPGGDARGDLWIADRRISFNPIADAEELVPAGSGFLAPTRYRRADRRSLEP